MKHEKAGVFIIFYTLLLFSRASMMLDIPETGMMDIGETPSKKQKQRTEDYARVNPKKRCGGRSEWNNE